MELREVATGFDYGMNAAAEPFDGTHRYIRITDIDEDTHEYNKDSPVSPSSSVSDEYRVRERDLLFARTGASTGKSYLYRNHDGEMYFAGFLIRARIKSDYNPYFIYSVTLGSQYKQWVQLTSMRSGQPGINAEEYASFRFCIPERIEQDRIAGLLAILDTRISAQRKLVELLKKHKRGVLNAIFETHLRMSAADGRLWPEWRRRRIGDVFQERTERGGLAEELLSVTINNGVRRQSDTDKKNSSSEDKSTYKKVHRGDIVYNTMRMWQGASGVSHWTGIVSPAYTVIYPRSAQNVTFWAYAFKHWRLIQTFQKFSQGLTSDTWNLKFPQLADIPILEPCLQEQNAIVDLLMTLDRRKTKAEHELNCLNKMKVGLLQQLFV